MLDWWSQVDKSMLKPINTRCANDAASNKLENGRLVCEMNDIFASDPKILQAMGNNPSGGGYFNISAYVTYVKNDDKVFYLACPEDNCRRKVVDNDGMIDATGKYRCEHCNRNYETCVPTFMLLAKIADFSDSVYVNFYRQQAELIMGGVTAEKIKELKEQGESAQVNDAFCDAQFKPFTFTVKATARSFQDETRLNFSCTKIIPHSFTAENK